MERHEQAQERSESRLVNAPAWDVLASALDDAIRRQCTVCFVTRRSKRRFLSGTHGRPGAPKISV